MLHNNDEGIPRGGRAVKIVLTYRMNHNWDVQDLLTEYRKILQKAIDKIWENAYWEERKVKEK